MSRQIAVRILPKEKILKSWTFVNLRSHQSPYSYVNFFTDIKAGNVSAPIEFESPCEHSSLVRVDSKQKINSEAIVGDPEDDMLPAIDIFENRFFSLYLKESCEECTRPKAPKEDKPNAFHLLMKTAKENRGKDDPIKFSNPSNGRERCLNAFLSHCEEKKIPVGCGKTAKKL